MKQIIEKKYVLEFFIYSMFGWIYEVAIEYFQFHHGFVNRGFCFGPYLPIYGTGALICIIGLKNIYQKKRFIHISKDKSFNITPIFMFFAIMFVCTFVELLGSYIMEMCTDSFMWNYSNYFLNFQGRIALNPSLRFGLGSMFFVYIIHPLFLKLTNSLSKKNTIYLSILIVMIMLIDASFQIFTNL